VLREGQQLKKKEEQEMKVLKDYEMNLRDEKEFERWKREMDEKAEIERLEHF
jgi:protein associated with RNAse G/E